MKRIVLWLLCSCSALVAYSQQTVSAELATRLNVHGYAQGTYTAQQVDGNSSNTFQLKRTLLWANAQINDRWYFQFMHDFNSVVQEYYTDYRVTNNKMLTVRVGQSKTGLTYENPLSPASAEMIDVCAESVTYLTGCGSDPLNGKQYGRDQGIFLFGETENGMFRYEVELVNGSGINVADNDNYKNLIGRLEFRPVSWINIIATGQRGKGKALVSAPVFNPSIVVGQEYDRNRLSLGFACKSRPLSLHGEYLAGVDGGVKSSGAYVTGSVALVPGQWDAVFSADYFNFNQDLDYDMTKLVAGVQYWFYKGCRVQAQYVYKNAVTDYRSFFKRADSHQLMCQFQIKF